MGNKTLRPDPMDPFQPFNDDQKSYLKDKFQSLCDEKTKYLSAKRISQQLKTSEQEAFKIINYIDFQGKGEVDDYEFICAAASLHQDDEEAQQFLFDLYKDGEQMTNNSFQSFFKTVFNYLKFMNLIDQSYTDKIGDQKFKQYDFNGNGFISLDEFRSLLQKDFHCSFWMQTLGFAAQKQIQRPEKPQNHELQTEEFTVEDSEGDQAGSTPSWIPVAKRMTNDQYKNIKRSNAPNQKLDINYVYGYRSYDTQSNLKYNAGGDAVYHHAACGIILNKAKNTQKINTQHNDDITCLDLNVKKGIVATGQLGKKPAIIIWDAVTAETKAIFQNNLEKSIACIAISPSGRYVAASSMSDKHQIAVYDINQKSLVAFGNGPRSVIYQIKFNSSEDQIICACAKEVVFASFSKGKLQCKKGVFGKAPCLPCYSIAVKKNNQCIISMQNGLLTQWKGTACSKIFKQHSKAVVALCERQNGGIISGDAEGNIVLWSQNMSVEKSYDLKKLLDKLKYNNLRIIALDQQYSNILIGTRGGQIYEINSKGSANLLIQGHYDNELWGLAISSSKQQFFTGGQDKLLIRWDVASRKCVQKKKLQTPINFLDLSKDNILAVGMRNGIVNLFDANNLKLLNSFHKYKNPDKDMISVVKFSPNGKKLAIAYAPPYSQIFIYDFSDTSAKPKICTGSPSRIVSIDFSRSGNAIFVNNTSYEILIYDANTGAQKTSATQFKNEQWSTLTAKFSWGTQGIWPSSDASNINTVDRSNSKKYVVTGDDYSTIKVFDYPVCEHRQISNKYKGHSSHITGVKWSYDDKYLISTGGLEKSIIQWTNTDQQDIKYDYQDIQQVEQKKQVDPQNEQEYEQDQIQQDKLAIVSKKIQKKEGGEDDMFQQEEDEGDQAGANKPFIGQVNNSTPSQYKVVSQKNSLPEQQLVIKQVWGVRNQYLTDRVRNQVKYSADFKSCLFITATLGVQMHLENKEQSFYKGQSEDLISFAISPDRKLCATGQMAELNKGSPKSKIVDVHVWDSQTKQKKAVLSKFHQRGIVVVSFSPSGQKLLTIGQDDKNSLAVYDWKLGRILWNSTVCGAKVTDAAWKSQTQYVTCGLKHIKFWNKQKGSMGKMPGNSKWDPMMCTVFWNGKFVSGGMSGVIYLWNGNAATATTQHKQKIDCLSTDQAGNLYSGDSSGRILSWKISGGKLVKDKQILSASTMDKIDPGILSIDFSPDKKMLVCTNSSSVYEIYKSETKTILQSHCKGELWAESWSPDGKQFVTAGDDKTIRIYDATNYQQKYIYKMKQHVRGIDWEQSQGQLIVVGDYKGKIYLFNTKLVEQSEVKTLFSKSKPRQQPYWIEDIKFSPDGKYVAFGAHGGASHIQIYSVQNGKISQSSRKIIKNIFSSALLSLDWSQDSSTIAAVSQAYELQFTSLSAKISASSVKDVKWASWSSKFGYQTKQIHQDCDYSNINAVCVNPTKTLVASGGDDQRIRLFNYPVNIPRQKNKEYIGHSSHVTRVRFSPDQQYLLSVGGNDRTIILWEVKGSKKITKAKNKPKEEQEQDQVNDDVLDKSKGQDNESDQNPDDNEDDEIRVPRPRQQKKVQQITQTEDFAVEEDNGDQFGACKPWKGAIKQPTNQFYKSTGNPPPVKLKLQYAHGYRTKDCRNNLKYIEEGKIAYHTAGLGIVMNTQDKQQKFFDLHNDDIISFYQNKNARQLIYTGQMGAKNTVYCWDANANKIKEFKGAKKGISAIIANQKYVVAACLDDDHEVFIWEAKTGKLIKSEKGVKQVIVAMEWTSQKEFVSVGIKHYKIWNIQGSTLKKQSGNFNKNNNILCAVAVKGSKIYVGSSDGLQLWNGKSCSKKIDFQKPSAIHALWVGEQVLLAGSSDNKITILNQASLTILQTINCTEILTGSIKPSIRSLDVWGDKILIGTLGSEIYEIESNNPIEKTTESSKFIMNVKLMTGHYAPHKVTNEVWGLSLYQKDSFITCSDDGTVRIWNTQSKEEIKRFQLFFEAGSKGKIVKLKEKKFTDSVRGRTVCVSQQKWIIIGCKDGTLKIVDQNFEPKFCGLVNKQKKQISQVKFSPDGRLLAVGDHLGFIYVYQWREGNIKLKHSKIKHSAYIKHFDFSRDSTTIHSTCGGYQLLFWDSQTGVQKKSGASQTRDQEWATWNVTLGWPVQGIFQSDMDGTDVNAVDRSNDKISSGKGKQMNLLASGDDNGKVRVLEYPCIIPDSQSVKGRGHSSHVTNVKFTSDDKFILSTGGEDQTVLQWKVLTKDRQD